MLTARSWLGSGLAWIWDIGRGDLLHGGVRYPIGRLSLQIGGGFESGDMAINVAQAETRGTLSIENGNLNWHAFFCSSPSVLVLELTGLRHHPGALLTWQPALQRPPGPRPKEGYAAKDLNPVPHVVTLQGGVDCTQSFLGGGGSAVVLRRVLSSPDRKVYVLAVDRGDTPARALSEATIAAERAASLGYGGLYNAHRAGFNVAGPWLNGSPPWVRASSGSGGVHRFDVPGWPHAFVRTGSSPHLVIWPAGAKPAPNEFSIHLPRGGWALIAPSPHSTLPTLPPAPARPQG